MVDPSGQPVAGARLSLRARNAQSRIATYQSGETDAAGVFLFEGAGRGLAHTLTLVATGFGRQLVDFDVADDAVDLGEIRLSAALRIEGRVVVPDGVERAGILVRLEGANADRGALRPDKPLPYKTGGQTEQRRTDDLGRFRFVLPTEHQVEAGTTEARFVLERSAEVRGIVRTPDGAVLPQAAIRIEQDGQHVAQQGGGGAWSDVEGRFRIRLPQRGVFDLLLTGAVNRIAGVNDDAPTNFTGALRGVTPGATDLVLRAVAPTFDRSLRVRVSTPHGAPWAHVQARVNQLEPNDVNGLTLLLTPGQ